MSRLGEVKVLIIKKNSGAYFVASFLGAASSLASIPFIIDRLGIFIWGQIAIGQTLGALLSIIILLGSPINGPNLIAKSKISESKEIIAISTICKALTLIPVFALTLVLLVFFSQGAYFISALSALLVLLSSLSLSWVFIGWDQPMKILTSETLPRFIGTLLGIISILLSESVYLYFAIQGFFLFYSIWKSLSLCAISWTKLLKQKMTFAKYIFFVRSQSKPTKVVVYSVLATSLPSLLLSQVSLVAFVYFSIAERFTRLFNLVANSLLQVFQSSFKSQNASKDHRARIFKSIKYFSILGFGASLMTIVLGGWAAGEISHGEIILQISALVPMAVSFLMMSLSRAVGIVGLVGFGEVKTVSDSALYGLLILVPSLVIFTLQFSYIGSLWSLTLMHIFILGFQTFKIIPFLNPFRFQDKPIITRTIKSDQG